MYILHIETSTKVCSVAISQDDQMLDYEEQKEAMNHASALAPMIANQLIRQGLLPGDLGAVSVSSGPGSYTGLRVGSSAAKAFAYSLNIPLVAVPTLEALNLAAHHQEVKDRFVLAMIDARRDEVFASLFNADNKTVWPDYAVCINQAFMEEHMAGLTAVICCGDGAFKVKPYLSTYPNLILQEDVVCSAKHLVSPAWTRLNDQETENPLHFTPRYMKPPNITQSRKTI
jgi:tRNA threonylcarbamoyladenosine biosynthesis protein TsaB